MSLRLENIALPTPGLPVYGIKAISIAAEKILVVVH
jgi:hypothetical protein